MVKVLIFISIVLLSFSEAPKDKNLIEEIMSAEPRKFKRILADREGFEIQVLYTQIDRDANNRPSFKSHEFFVDSTKYFYPASTIKLPLVVLALEKLNALKIPGVDKYTPVFFDSVYSGQRSVKMDPTSPTGLPSIAHFCRKILMVSDNEASNCLYEFLGQKAANKNLQDKGYDIRILQRLERAATYDENRHTEPARFVKDGATLYSQPMLINPDSIRPPGLILKGKGFIQNQRLIRKPFDFTYKNSFPLREQQEILKAIIFPDEVPSEKRFGITSDDRRFILQYMSQLPSETRYPDYRSDTSLHDAACKFFMFAGERAPIPKNIRIFNKIGGAYGYLVDNAYIVDFENGVEFMLSAVINVNTDGIYNDDKYEYESVGYPFMRDLGQAVYRYELGRSRKHKPDLSEFALQYDEPRN
ncbi:MAG TPA: serine hydrolase [Cyclobacteriaceae bacterium]|nr:serine hydrolase [Cyclobacteriaceae bacterium]